MDHARIDGVVDVIGEPTYDRDDTVFDRPGHPVMLTRLRASFR